MPVRQRLVPWLQQPQETVDIDPVAGRDVVGAWLYDGSSPLRNVASSIGPLVPTGATRVAAERGVVYDLSGSGQYLTASQTVATQLPLSFAVWVYPDSLGSNARIFDISTGTTADDVIGVYRSTADGGTFRAQHYDGSTNAEAAYPSDTYIGSWVRLGGVFRSLNSRTLYINGVPVSTNTASVSAPSGINRVTIGYAPWTGGEYLDGRVQAAVLATRALSDAEMLEDFQNTWGLLMPQRKLIPRTSSAPAFNPAWARGSNIMIGAGVAL